MQVPLRIANKTIVLKSDDKNIIDKIRFLYKDWITEKISDEDFEIDIDVKYEAIIDDIPSFNSLIKKEGYCFYFKDNQQEGYLDFKKKIGKFEIQESDIPLYFIYWKDNFDDLANNINRTRDIYPFIYCADSTLNDNLKLAVTSFDYSIRKIIIQYLGCLSYFEETYFIHGCSVMRNNKGYIFIGCGGAGKSTIGSISNKLKNTLTLNDDMNVVSLCGKKFQIFPLPFKTTYNPKNITTELAGICSLKKSKETYVKDMDKNQRLKIFLKNTPICMNKFVKEITDRKILNEVKWRELYFKKDPSFWEELEKDETSN